MTQMLLACWLGVPGASFWMTIIRLQDGVRWTAATRFEEEGWHSSVGAGDPSMSEGYYVNDIKTRFSESSNLGSEAKHEAEETMRD